MRKRLRIVHWTTVLIAVVFVFALGWYGIPARGQMAGVPLHISGDTNIQEMFDKDLLPLFQRASSVKTKMVFLEQGMGAEAIVDKILGAHRSGQRTALGLYEPPPP